MTANALDERDHEIAESSAAKLRRRIFGNSALMLGGGVLAAMLLIAASAPLLTPYSPYAQDLSQRLIEPVWHASGSWAHPFGTDQLGRDYLCRILYGTRISLLIGSAATLISGLIGITLGLLAGYYGGGVDLAVTFLITTRLAMPVVLIALSVVALVGGSLQVVILVLGLLLWDRFAVVTRGATQQVRSLDYVGAALATGCSSLRVIVSEILPNIASPLIVVATLEMAQAILLEASLSFLGLGVQPPLPSWGLMISEGKEYMFFSPWVIAVPGVALFVLVLAINLVGDGIQTERGSEGRA